VVQALRLLGWDQGWSLGEIAPALALEAGLATGVAAVLLGAASRLDRPRIVATLALLLLAGLTAWGALAHPGRANPGSPRTEAAADPTTLVLVTLDTLRRDHVSAYPDSLTPGLTPHLEALAASGVRFDDAVTTAPLTLPSHTTLLSGVPPDRHGVVRNGRVVPRSLEGAPTALGEAGYRTAAFVSTSVLHGSHGLARWFDVYRDELGPWPGARRLPLAGLLPLGRSTRRLVKEPGDRTVDRALAWLGRQGDEPVFLWVHLYDAHTPHAEREGFTPAAAALPDPCGWRGHPTTFRAGPRAMLPMMGRPIASCGDATRDRVLRMADGYAGEVAFLDAQVGRLVAGLTDQGRWGTTTLIAVADHGESLAEHHQHGSHEHSIYEPVARVPLIVRTPGGRAATVDAQVSTVRVAATLLEAAGLPAGDGAVGPSLLEGGEERPAVVVGPSPLGHLDGNHPQGGSGLQIAVRLPPYKTLVDGQGYVERYDLSEDPLEQRPQLSPTERELVMRIRRERSAAGLPGLPPLPLPGPPGQRRDRPAPDLDPLPEPAEDVAAWSPLHDTARALLAAWAAGATREDSGLDPDAEALPPEVLEALRALGYTE